jgi:IS5 family transposase
MMTVSFASLAYENKKKRTRREKFLQEMDQIIPWEELLQIIKQYYPKAGNGRQPMGIQSKGVEIVSGSEYPFC